MHISKVLEVSKTSIILEFDDGSRCKIKMLKSHMKALYRFLRTYLDFMNKKER